MQIAAKTTHFPSILMALFGKKAKDAPSAPLTADDTAGASGGPTTLTADDTFGTTPQSNGKAAREPKTPKNKTVKNGVAVGLNIGNQFIKAVEVTSKGGDLSVTAMGVVPTPPESYSNGNVLSVSALSGAIKDLWRTAGIKSKVAITSVAGTGALVVRVIEVPKMSDGELKANMQVDADRYIPFPPSEVVMDFKALRELPSDPDAPNMEVLLAAAQREVIDLHVNVVQKAKLSPRAIDVEPIAAVRAMQLERQGNHSFADYNEVTALVNIGATGAEISILRGDVLVFTRSVPNGGNSVTQAISDGMGISFADAERLKISSADALAPAGYNAGADFGFGGADDFDFGTPSAASPGLTEDFGTAAGTASADPFDLDFFDQDPPKNEPGAGHAQKEDDTKGDASPFDFDFAAPPAPSQPAAASKADEETTSAFDFSFESPDPSPAASSPASPSTPPASSSPFGCDFGDSEPSEAESTTTASKGTQPLSETTSATDPFLMDDTAPSVASTGAPASQDVAPTVPSAFDFDNFDLPAVQPGAPSSTPVAPAAPEPASAFSFDAVTPQPSDPPAATPASEETGAEQSASPGDSQFDLDSIFGTPATTPTLGALDATISTQSPTEATASNAAPVAEELGLTDIGTGFDAPATSFAAPADDFAAFGAAAGSTSSSEAVALYNLIYAPLEELSNEMRRSLEFHLGRYPDATISRLVLMGGGAKLRNLDVFLTQMLGVPTVVGNPFTLIPVRSAKLPADYATENGPMCTIALGLALRDFID